MCWCAGREEADARIYARREEVEVCWCAWREDVEVCWCAWREEVEVCWLAGGRRQMCAGLQEGGGRGVQCALRGEGEVCSEH